MNRVIKLPDRACGTVRELSVLFQDAQLLALNKPAGITVTTHSAQPEPSALLPLLHTAVAEQKGWAMAMGLDYLMGAHRPETDTSGVWILARDRDTLTALADQFGSGAVTCRHLALIRGAPGNPAFTLDARLIPHPDRPGQMRSDPRRGRRYRTRCTVMERFRGYTPLHCPAVPGRPGQIAAHLRQARMPLVADQDRGGAGLFLSRLKRDYSPKKGMPERPLIGRSALHLESVRIKHPATGADLEITAPLAKDFRVALKYLRDFARA